MPDLQQIFAIIYFPSQCRKSIIVAIPKSHKLRSDLENYGIISLLNSFRKILEKRFLDIITPLTYSIIKTSFSLGSTRNSQPRTTLAFPSAFKSISSGVVVRVWYRWTCRKTFDYLQDSRPSLLLLFSKKSTVRHPPRLLSGSHNLQLLHQRHSAPYFQPDDIGSFRRWHRTLLLL